MVAMSKAILVMDMPSSCGECKLQDMCLKDKGCIPFYRRDKACSLKEVPEKMEHPLYGNIFNEDYRRGYNACIDEILRGE